MIYDNVRWMEDHGPLRRVWWDFMYFDDEHALVVDHFIVEERATLRHKFKTTENYDRMPRGGSIREEDVPLTEEVRARAIHEFCANLRVTRWEVLRPPRSPRAR